MAANLQVSSAYPLDNVFSSARYVDRLVACELCGIGLKKVAKTVLRKLGYEIRRVHRREDLLPNNGIESLSYKIPVTLRDTIDGYTMLSRGRLQSLANAAYHVMKKEVRGDIVQCGVWRGGSAALIAHVIQSSGGPLRNLHLLDSFEGIPEPDGTVDGERAIREAREYGTDTNGELVPNPQFYLNMGRPVGYIEDVQSLLEEKLGYDRDFIFYHKGMFEDVIPRIDSQIDSISLLHLDGDLYSSTKVCLEYLYDKVVSGGIVIIDDYGAYDGCRKAVDEFLRQRGAHPYLHQVDSEVVMFEKR